MNADPVKARECERGENRRGQGKERRERGPGNNAAEAGHESDVGLKNKNGGCGGAEGKTREGDTKRHR